MFAFLKRNQFFLLDLGCFIYITGYGIQLLSANLLIQDKICTNVHKQTKHFCQNIHKTMHNPDDELMKNKILSESARFDNYKYELNLNIIKILSIFFPLP